MAKWVDQRTGKEFSTTAVIARYVMGVGAMLFLLGFVILCIVFVLSGI